MIRAGRSDDDTTVRKIAEAAYAPFVVRIGRRPAPMDVDARTAAQKGRLHVWDDGQLRAFLICWDSGGDMFVENLAVLPDAQGAGLGRLLLGHAEGLGRQAGSTRLTLYTNLHMTENIRWYRALGFDETNRVIEDGFERVYFARPLS